MTDDLDTQTAYLDGSYTALSTHAGYLAGAVSGSDSQSVYIKGVVSVTDSLSAFVSSSATTLSSIFAYLTGQEGSEISAYLEGDTMAVDYIILTTSDSSLSKKFRVLAQGYDDGTLEKAESRQRTLGGGIDHSAGAVYKIWNPVIKVRHTEAESGYGSLSDLEYLYSLNRPNGTPSNVITFTDHHSVENLVRFAGTFRKAYLGTSIEGSEAWATVALQLERIYNE